MVWIYIKPFCFFPGFDDILIWRYPFQRFESFGEVLGFQEVKQMLLELLVRFVLITFYSSLFEGLVHAFNLRICPWVVWLCQAVFNAMLKEADMEHVTHKACRGTITITRLNAKLSTIISQHSMDFIGYDLYQITKEV